MPDTGLASLDLVTELYESPIVALMIVYQEPMATKATLLDDNPIDWIFCFQDLVFNPWLFSIVCFIWKIH